MARAAAELAVSQPVVSKTITALEHSLNARVFDRSSKGVELTDYGHVLLARTRVAFDEIDEAIKSIETLKDPTSGEIRIGCPESMTVGLLPRVIERFATRYPNVVIHVVQANTFPLDYAPLRERKVDLMLGRISPTFNEPDIDAEILFNEQLALVVGRRNPLGTGTSVRLADFLNERWILAPADSAAGSLWAEAFENAKLPLPKISIVTFSMNLRNFLVASGRYVTLLPMSVWKFNAERFALREIAIKLDLSTAPVAIVTMKGRSVSPVVGRFMQAIREECIGQGLKAGRKYKKHLNGPRRRRTQNEESHAD